MYLVTYFPQLMRKHDVIWVTVDLL